jgi:hypothetical protein
MRRLFSWALLLCVVASPALALDSHSLVDDQTRQMIINESIAGYQATGHPCACPYNSARNGSGCGGRSAYSQPGGAAPLRFPKMYPRGWSQIGRRAIRANKATLLGARPYCLPTSERAVAQRGVRGFSLRIA